MEDLRLAALCDAHRQYQGPWPTAVRRDDVGLNVWARMEGFRPWPGYVRARGGSAKGRRPSWGVLRHHPVLVPFPPVTRLQLMIKRKGSQKKQIAVQFYGEDE